MTITTDAPAQAGPLEKPGLLDIRHRIGITSPSEMDVYDALTTIDGLSRWWTTDTTGDPGYGGTIHFAFAQGFFDMKVIETEPGKKVRWQVVDGPEEWIGTTVDWQLVREGDQTTVLFAHEGWAEPVEFMHHCSTKWATFLLSLRSFVETGGGSPAPHDLKIDNYEAPNPLRTSS